MAKRESFTTEAELARIVVAWLADQGWEIYQEVQPGGGAVADIVGKRGPVLCVVECKLSMGLRVLDQADTWLQHAHYVYVAVPNYSTNRDRGFAWNIARMLGIGVLGVHTGGAAPHPDWHSVSERVKPEFRRHVDHRYLSDALNDKQKTFAEAGNALGKRWTPFQQTCEQVRIYAQLHPGAPLKEVIDNVKTHYSTPTSARNSLAKWIETGAVPGLRLERLGRIMRVWPDETPTKRKG